MAFVENAPGNVDSEMEEGEIVDDLDDLSDISSEEEFLLRQRLQVLENYNNVLERKKAKDASFGPGNRNNHSEDVLLDLSEISATDLDDGLTNNVIPTIEPIVHKHKKEQRHLKSHHKPKRKKELEPQNSVKSKDYKKKVHRKKRLELKVISESSEESDDEYRNKRRKLANAVALNRNNIDKSSLHDRLQNMLSGNTQSSLKNILSEEKQIEIEISREMKDVSCSPMSSEEIPSISSVGQENLTLKETQELCELIDLCTDDDGTVAKVDDQSVDVVDSVTKEKSEDENKIILNADSDEDLEQLRQHALKSKSIKTKTEQQAVCSAPEKPIIVVSEDEDSDTAELRLICLKSALLKKAIEMKQKQKLRKRLSQSSVNNIQDDFLDEYKELEKRLENNNDNNTDIESVDMDIGSDADDKSKEISSNSTKVTAIKNVTGNEHKENIKVNPPKDDDLEEDEDLLRAKLLTSLSKNLPNLVDPNVVMATDEKSSSVPKNKVPENRIVINLGESDSEGEEHEATKNLTKMHMKLSEQIDFQQKLDMFLKSTRMEVEKKKLPDMVNNPVTTPEKFVAKTVNHLPKSEQIEYKNLVKKMAELEKIKEARQATMNIINQTQVKETLKPRNVSLDTSKLVSLNMLEEQFAMSRKRIAEESARMMKLKEEATKLTQKYKIVANELKNISTAITLNKREQRTVQNRLSKVRLQHQRLLNSPLNKHSKINGNNVLLSTNRLGNLQKENNPMKNDYKNHQTLKNVKVSIANDIVEDSVAPNPRLSVQVDVTSNTKIVTSFPSAEERIVDIDNSRNENMDSFKESNVSIPGVEKGGGSRRSDEGMCAVDSRTELRIQKDLNEYESPLLSLAKANWEADPNAIMCPFEVGGNCKDADCKYLHPKVPSQ